MDGTDLPTGTALKVQIKFEKELGRFVVGVLEKRLIGTVVLAPDDERRWLPITDQEEPRFLGPPEPSKTTPPGQIVTTKPDDTFADAQVIIRVKRVESGGGTVRVQVFGWQLAGEMNMERLGQLFELDLDLEGLPAGALALLRENTLVLLPQAALRFRVASPKDTLLRALTFEHSLLVDEEGKAKVLRVWGAPNRVIANGLPATEPRFDIFVADAVVNSPGKTAKVNAYDIGTQQAALNGFNDTVPESVGRLPYEDQMFVSDALFTWNHWSLVAPNPILKVADEPMSTDAPAASGPALVCMGEPPPGSLPRMRFGRSYEVQIRGVDIAGIASRRDTAMANGNAERPNCVAFHRFDPMGAPIVVRALEGLAPGPDAYLHVERDPTCDTDTSSEGPGDNEHNEIVFKSIWKHDRFVNDANASRADWLVIPPPAAMDLLLAHGVLDGNPDEAFAHLEEIRLAAERGRHTGSFPYSQKVGMLPYTADPLARFVTILVTGTPRDKKDSGKYPLMGLELRGQWPRFQAARIRIRASEGKSVRQNRRSHVLDLSIPPGEVCELAISAAPSVGKEKLLGLWHMVESRGTHATTIRKAICDGRHPLVSGVRRVRVVHAVDRPSRPPVITSLVSTGVRMPGSQTLSLICSAEFDAVTTGQISLHGQWDEYVDHPDRPYPAVPPEEALRCFDPFTEDMSREEFETFLKVIIEWRTSPTSRDWWLHFGFEYPQLMEQYTKDAPWFWEAMRQFATPSVGTATLLTRPFSRPEPGEQPKSGRFDFVHTFDDTRYRQVKYHARALTCFTREFPDAQPVESVASKVGVALSTAPPLVPDIAYVMPLFGRDPGGDVMRDGEERHRKGLALRIYLRRPWYSTGQGEELALVFASDDRPERALRERVTEWGYDPAWYGPTDRDTRLPQLRAEWCLWRSSTEQINIPDPTRSPGNNWKVEVAPHSVRFSPVRGLWYCDVLFPDKFPEPNGRGTVQPYLPFVRLALARYQPYALPQVRLSGIVTLDFVQLQPSRTLVVRRTGQNTVFCTVTGALPTNDDDGSKRRVEAMVQRLGGGDLPPLAEVVAAGPWHELERDEQHKLVSYSGHVPLPRFGGSRLELIVRECELIDTADRFKQPRIMYAERAFLSH